MVDGFGIGLDGGSSLEEESRCELVVVWRLGCGSS